MIRSTLAKPPVSSYLLPPFRETPFYLFGMAFATINSSALKIAPIEEAFATEPSLKKRVYDTIGS